MYRPLYFEIGVSRNPTKNWTANISFNNQQMRQSHVGDHFFCFIIGVCVIKGPGTQTLFTNVSSDGM
jgi:hypothetical protein